MTSIVALDLETTGLDPKKDAIIEIGAVRFNGRRVEAEWSSLINPGRPIPPFITQLTGITDQMVLRAPPIKAVLSDLEGFAGDVPILGHNVNFDLSFIRRQKILANNMPLDTYELASVLLPNADRYNLGALAQALNVPLQATHRALDDAHATRGVFLRLLDEAMQLPLHLLAEIVRLCEPLEWNAKWVFRQVLRSRTKEIVSSKQVRHAYDGPLFEESQRLTAQPLQPLEESTPLDPDEVAAFLEHGGIFSKHFPQYEYRPQQVAMLRAIAEAISFSKHLMVEAGTGTGKSMAYLIPAALWAIQNNTRVVISTNTINLQDQLINKDIPDLRDALGLDLKAVIMKGRSNYLCPRRLESLRRRGPENADDMRILAKILVWLKGTHTGDRAELNLNGPTEREVWTRISAEDDGCTTENCLKRTGGICPFFRSRQLAQSANLLIVNHALLLSDIATGNRVLPEYDVLIVDEAHHLEDATTNALSYRINQNEVERMLRELGGPNAGALGWLLEVIQETVAPEDVASFSFLVQRITDYAFRLQSLVNNFFVSVDQFLYEQREGRSVGAYSHQERITAATRTQPAWADVELSWDEAQRTMQPLIDTLTKLIQGVTEIIDLLSEEDEELFGTLSSLYRRFTEFNENMNALVFEPDPERIYWAQSNSNSWGLSLHAAPLHIGQLMQKYLWHEKSSVILTSATLTAAGEFDYLRGRLYAEDSYELALGSPFDYQNAALVYIANDIPEPGDRHGHQRALEIGLVNLCRVTGGKTLVLFTSYDQLKRTSSAISPILAKEDILVYEQGEGASPHSLLESFRSADRAVLLGTRAFWEGVDVPGEALSVLVIAKLPFDVPSDPIISARSETFEDPFYQYALPEAILRFRQGFGRLIRTQYDRGVVAVLDKRVLTKRYGRAFLESLPECTIRTGALSNLPGITAQWLNL
ncbi:MAG TPA: helicase C-terminal domain-containing protein [Anaerolineales bacterium]|nr:helicase C-terminal domain-containing protein [Anaerolineales bacterium]